MSRSPVGGPALSASFGGYVRYPDPTTGEPIYRVRTPEDGALPGDRRTFEGYAAGLGGNPSYIRASLPGGEKTGWTDAQTWLAGLFDKRIRITVEVLPEPPTDGRTSGPIDCKHLNADRREDGWHCRGCGLVGNLTLRDGDWVVAAPSSEGGQR